jgi:hypothetical protein
MGTGIEKGDYPIDASMNLGHSLVIGDETYGYPQTHPSF